MTVMKKYLERALDDRLEEKDLNGKRDIEFRDDLNRAADFLMQAVNIASKDKHPELKSLKKALDIIKKIRVKYDKE